MFGLQTHTNSPSNYARMLFYCIYFHLYANVVTALQWAVCGRSEVATLTQRESMRVCVCTSIIPHSLCCEQHQFSPVFRHGHYPPPRSQAHTRDGFYNDARVPKPAASAYWIIHERTRTRICNVCHLRHVTEHVLKCGFDAAMHRANVRVRHGGVIRTVFGCICLHTNPRCTCDSRIDADTMRCLACSH